ncbi:RHO1 GDP-GTP exchange protein 2 [Xylographa opegraphella]|nr:RHO1 GDP-GTP exchange protein 2 [Xylographa opegraphella]
MADYGVQQGRVQRQNPYGHPSSYQRDAAFSNIFGAPPPGRSQTMQASQLAQLPAERSRTISTQSSVASQISSTASSRPAPVRAQQNGYVPPMTNGFYQAPRQPDGSGPQQQPPVQYLPQPMNPERRPYPQPQRVEPRQPNQPQYNQQYNRPFPNRVPPPPGPALNADAFRSRSMATMSNPQAYNPPQNSYNQASANSFRQQQYHPMGSRTTAQGRIVPERHDERAMSMTAWGPERDHNQTMSGRVIPNRRRDSGQDLVNSDPFSPPTAFGIMSPTSPPDNTGRTMSVENMSSRTMSMASSTTVTPERNDSLQHRPSVAKASGSSSSSTVVSAQTRTPLVYPALLSRVAQVFLERINAGERNKNELSYKLAFTGGEAVDLISYIIKTTDRNLALLLGRALDAQKFFHDVTYEHRLRDLPSELYQFRETVMEDPSTNVNGVFTLLTECYSPTCTRDKLCYSIACPRRLEQQSRLNLKPLPGLRREPSTASLHAEDNDEQKLWINTVSKEVADSVGEKEKKRQEVISEIMYTERDFVKDLEYLRDFWMKPLRSNNPATSYIPEQRREKFVRAVFSNCMDVHAVNSRLAEALTRRQQENPVVRNVGDIFLTFVPKFDPFVTYGANQLFGKWEFEKERGSNPAFSKFVDDTERLKESRKLELNGYLTKPTTRLARYPLLLENVLKFTAEDNPDMQDIPNAVTMIKGFLNRVNIESGKSENAFNLMMLSNNLKFQPGEYIDLKLTEEGRQMIFKGPLKKGPTDSSEIMVFLFDHAVLLAKQRIVNKREELKVYRRPIPLELLVVLQMDEIIPKMGVTKRPSSSLTLGARNALNAPKITTGAKEGFPITFKHLGRPQYEISLYAGTQVQRRKWLEHIEGQQSLLRERTHVYKQDILCGGFFNTANKVNCLVPIDGGRKLVFGTDAGVFISDRKPKAAESKPRRMLDVSNVTQIDVLEEYQLLLVLANKNLVSYPLQALDPSDTQSPLLKRPKKIQGHANFFKAGVCLGRHLVCTAKSSGLSTTVKVFEPLDTVSSNNGRPALSRLFQGSQESLKPFKVSRDQVPYRMDVNSFQEFYIPAESTSIHFLKSKLCVACARGFEVVSLETLETQALLDQADTSLDFVAREKDTKPVHIERLNGEFLLSYSDFSFFVNRNGWRARPDWKITWEGQPTAFALSYPYILAFEPSFIEIRHVETSACVHILTGRNIRMLHSSTREIIYAYEEESGEDVVASLDFWSRGQ